MLGKKANASKQNYYLNNIIIKIVKQLCKLKHNLHSVELGWLNNNLQNSVIENNLVNKIYISFVLLSIVHAYIFRNCNVTDISVKNMLYYD